MLRFDDGMVVTVDEDLVLGRRPDNHELVTSGSARPVPIADTQNVLSSAHAALQRAGREVSLVDLGSLNGTHVAGPEATEWTQLEPGVAHPLSDGDRLLLGWTVITFEQPQDWDRRTSGRAPVRPATLNRSPPAGTLRPLGVRFGPEVHGLRSTRITHTMPAGSSTASGATIVGRRRRAGRVLGRQDQLVAVGPRRPGQLHRHGLGPACSWIR